MSEVNLYTFIAYLEDRPGSMNRVVSQLRHRRYNIESLTMGGTERRGVSRLTLVVKETEAVARRIGANLYKLLDVLHVEAVSDAPTLLRELTLVKIAILPECQAALFEIFEEFQARVINAHEGSVVVEVTGAPQRVDSFIDMLRPFGIFEVVRTGVAAMTRASVNSASAALDEKLLAFGASGSGSSVRGEETVHSGAALRESVG